MKIIISPSKNQDFSHKIDEIGSTPEFQHNAEELVNIISKFPKEELGNIMKIENKLLDNTYKSYSNFSNSIENNAIASYTGTVFKEIKLEEYSKVELKFMNEHLVILSALYGALKPFDLIKPYRLDMTMKILETLLCNYWKKYISYLFKNEDFIINLASDEFSKLIKTPMINVSFKENKEGKYKIIGTYAKKARGLLVNYIIKNQITDIDNIKNFNLEGYSFNPEISSNNNIVFTRVSKNKIF